MLDDYPAQVKAAYLKMCSDGTVSVNLKKPTPNSLRQESVVVYRRKNTLRDKDIVCTFLELKHEDNLEPFIRQARLNKFRAVQNFLTKDIPNPRYDNIEFIAWLIDFKLDLNGQDHLSTDKENTIQGEKPIEQATLEKDVNDELENDGSAEVYPDENKITEEVGEGQDKKEIEKEESLELTIKKEVEYGKGKRKRIYAIAALLALFGSGAYFAFNYKPDTNNTIQPFVTTDCMYWAGDHYELVACNSAASHVQHQIPFDAFEWKYLKKINCPDTLTDNDIGKVWYMKVKNDIELYTAKGRYPLDTNRVLRPLSKYMLDQYIPRKKKVAFLEWALKGISAVAIVAFLGLIWALWARASAKKAKLSSP